MLHFLLAFTVGLVTLPAVNDFLSTALMMPVATVCLTSHTAKWPERGMKEISGKWHRAMLLSLCVCHTGDGGFSSHDLVAIPSLPRGGYSENVSTCMALQGTICTMAVSPDFKALGLSSSF